MMGGGLKKDKKFIAKIIKQLLNGKKEIFIVDDKMGLLLIHMILQRMLKFLLKTRFKDFTILFVMV